MMRKNRNQESRSANQRPAGYKPPGANPLEGLTLGDAVTLRLVRKFYTGAEEDKQNFLAMSLEGWVPVKATEVPEKFQYLKDNDGNIAYLGCVLCKNDAQRVEWNRTYFEDKAAGALASAQGEFESNGQDGRMPKFSEGSSKVFKGRVPVNA